MKQHDRSNRDLEKNDINMPGSTGSQGNPSDVRRDDLESSEVGASSRSGNQSGTSGSSRTGSGSSSSSDLDSPSRSSSSDVSKNR